MAHQRSSELLLLLSVVLAVSFVRADDDNSTETISEAPAEATLSDLPTLSSSTTSEATVPVACAGARQCGEVANSISVSSKTSSMAAEYLATATTAGTAAFATKTAGGMEPYADQQDVVILHDDSSISYTCPNADDKWTTESLTDSLTAKTATGAGCSATYTFTGDTIQVYGATGTDAGVFGCSVDIGSDINSTEWWNAYGTTNTYKPYQGACLMQGLGYDVHTIQYVNSAYEPGKIYFTGLHYTINSSQTAWETHTWAACCAEYTYPDGVATTVSAAASATSTSTTVAGFETQTVVGVMVALFALIIVSSLLVGCLCCRKRKAASPQKNALLTALHKDEATRPLRKHHSRHSTDDSPSSDTETETETETEESTGSEDEKRSSRHRKRR